MIMQARSRAEAQMMGLTARDAEFASWAVRPTEGALLSFPPEAEDDPKNAALVKQFRYAK